MAMGVPAKEPLPQPGPAAPWGCFQQQTQTTASQEAARGRPFAEHPLLQRAHLIPQTHVASQGCRSGPALVSQHAAPERDSVVTRESGLSPSDNPHLPPTSERELKTQHHRILTFLRLSPKQSRLGKRRCRCICVLDVLSAHPPGLPP